MLLANSSGPLSRLLAPRTVALVIAVDAVLVLLGLLLYPTSLSQGGLAGIAGDILILLAFGALALLSPISLRNLDSFSLRLGMSAGLLGGLLMVLDLLSGYLFAPSGTVSQITSLGAYGLFALLTLACGLMPPRASIVSRPVSAPPCGASSPPN